MNNFFVGLLPIWDFDKLITLILCEKQKFCATLLFVPKKKCLTQKLDNLPSHNFLLHGSRLSMQKFLAIVLWCHYSWALRIQFEEQSIVDRYPGSTVGCSLFTVGVIVHKLRALSFYAHNILNFKATPPLMKVYICCMEASFSPLCNIIKINRFTTGIDNIRPLSEQHPWTDSGQRSSDEVNCLDDMSCQFQ